MSGMRRAIARNLLASKQNIPHFYMRLTIDADPMMTFYRAEKAKYPCSVNDVVALACARAIAEFPAFRSRLEGEEVVELPGANVGIAVGLEGGLVVPVLVSAERMNFRQLAAETKRLAEAARKGKIEGLGQGVFTITNLGMFGVEEFSAIINPPEASILAVGAVREDVIVREGAMRPGRVMTMTLSADHRLIDGLLAAKFLARLKELLQAPAALA
jgi:pyruvate dehydrogenase E2 component (dihydrolipoamide acetyltransferase)